MKLYDCFHFLINFNKLSPVDAEKKTMNKKKKLFWYYHIGRYFPVPPSWQGIHCVHTTTKGEEY